MLPTDTKCENPSDCSLAQSSMAVHKAPDCETKATRPPSGIEAAKLALSFAPGTMMPRQLGPDDRHVGKFGDRGVQCLVQLGSGRAHFAKPRRQHDQAANARVAALAHQLGHRGGRSAQDRQIDGLRQRGDVGIGLQALQGFVARIDRIHRPGETGADEIFKRRGADLSGLAAGADDGHRFGGKDLG